MGLTVAPDPPYGDASIGKGASASCFVPVLMSVNLIFGMFYPYAAGRRASVVAAHELDTVVLFPSHCAGVYVPPSQLYVPAPMVAL